MCRIGRLVLLLLIREPVTWGGGEIPGPEPQQQTNRPQGTKSPGVPVAGVNSILVPGKDWELLGQGYQLTADSAVSKDGSVYFTDARHNRIHKMAPNGSIT